MAGKQPRTRTGAFSSVKAISSMDKRTREARSLKRTIDDLTEHLGGHDKVSSPQLLLIRTCAVLVMRLEAIIDRYLAENASDTCDKHFIAFQNSLRHNLQALGMERPKEQAPTLAKYLAERELRVVK